MQLNEHCRKNNMTITEALDKAYKKLRTNVEQPRLDAEVVLSSLLKKDRSYLTAHGTETLKTVKARQFEKLINRRSKNEPLAYILGYQPFYSQNFLVNKHTLIPRPETEQLIDEIKKHFRPTDKLTIIAVGTGCGNIALTLAKEFKNSAVFALDISKRALKIAEKNKANLEIKNVKFLHSDLLSVLPNMKADIIVANLPYLTKKDLKDSPTAKEISFEPSMAFLAKDEGLALIKKIMKQGATAMNPKGKMYLECDPSQSKKIKNWLKKEKLPYKFKVIKDFNKHDRVIILELVK